MPKPIGHRFRHDTLHSVVYLVEYMDMPYGAPFDCPSCQIVHTHKTVHFWLESDGTVIVSTVIKEQLDEREGHGLTYVGDVIEPPIIKLGLSIGPNAVNAVQVRRPRVQSPMRIHK